MAFFSHLTNETEPTPCHRPDQPLVRAGVPDGPTRRTDPTCQCVVRNGPPIPHGTDELLFAHHAIAVPHQIDQQVEHLRFQVCALACSMQLTPITIDFTVCKYKSHEPAPAK